MTTQKYSLMIVIVLLSLKGAANAQYTWTAHTSATFNWSDASNWSTGTVPPATATSEVIFPGATASTNQTMTIDLNTGGNQTLQGGLLFSFLSGDKLNPFLNLEGNELILDGNTLQYNVETTGSNTVTFSNGTVQIGTAANASSINLGGGLVSGQTGATGTNELMSFAGGSTLNTLNTASILVASSAISAEQNFTLDLSAANLVSGTLAQTLTTGTLAAGNFLGTSPATSANREGTINLGSLTALTVNQDLILGQNDKTTSSNATVSGSLVFDGGTGTTSLMIGHSLQLGVGNGATGSITGVPSQLFVTIGSPGTPTANLGVLYVGYNNSTSINVATTSGSFATSGGTLNAYVSELRIGQNISTTGSAVGTFDFRSSTLGVLNVSGSAVIGEGTNAAGTLYLQGGQASSTSLTVGQSTSATPSVLSLNNTDWEVGGMLLVGGEGSVQITVGSTSAGLDLTSSTSGNFSILSGGTITMELTDPVGATNLWGVRMLGNQISLFDQYVTNDQLTADGTYGSDATVFYDGTYTYYGIMAVPEPSELILLAIGTGILVIFMRGRARHA